MYLNFSYEQEFIDLMFYLRSKYPKKLIDLEGIGSDLDIAEFSRKFFQTKTSNVDVSVDSNGNQSDLDLITYNVELPKPILKINSYYVLWKKLKQLYGSLKAHDVIEKQVNGTIYINDFHGIGAGLSYSYSKDTTVIVKVVEIPDDLPPIETKENIHLFTMEELFIYAKSIGGKVEALKDRTQINLEGIIHPLTGNVYEFYTLDKEDTYTKLKFVLSHKPHHFNKMTYLETLGGCSTIVTSNHPVIKTDEQTSEAYKLKPHKSFILSEKPKYNTLITKKISKQKFTASCETTNSLAYMLGMACTDELMFEHVKPFLEQNKVFSSNIRVNDIPSDIFEWNPDTIKRYVAGIIDSKACVTVSNNNTLCIRTNEFKFAQKVSELFKFIDFKHVKVRFYPKGRECASTVYRYCYYVTFIVNDESYLELSNKIDKNKEWCIMPNKKDTWVSPKLFKKFFLENTDIVYDITTESGTFYSQGLIQHNCFNFSTFDIMLLGLPMVKKIKSIPPKYLTSFKSQLEQFITIAANSTLGATGIADIFIVMSHYVEQLLETKRDNFELKDEKACWEYIRETIVSFVYTVNQPMRGGAQSPFTNVSIFDDNFLDELIPGYIYNGKEPNKEIIKKLQVLFLDIMNLELKRTSITFPVTTACFAIDDSGNILDDAFADMIADKNMDFGFINLYCGKTSTLSSCCFGLSEVIEVYNEVTDKTEVLKLKDFVDMYINQDEGTSIIPKKYKINSYNFSKQTEELCYITGVLKKRNNHKELIKITANGATIGVTPDHLITVYIKETKELKEVTAEYVLNNYNDILIPVI